MKLIPLEEVEKLISDIDKCYADNHWVILWLKRDIESIDTIDPIAIIDEMIEEYEDKINEINPEDIMWEEDLDRLIWKKYWLNKLKSRLTNNN